MYDLDSIVAQNREAALLGYGVGVGARNFRVLVTDPETGDVIARGTAAELERFQRAARNGTVVIVADTGDQV